MTAYISRFTTITCGVLFLLGVVTGKMIYDQRSPNIIQHIAGTNAITLHFILAGILAGAIIASLVLRRKLGGSQPYPVWIAPFTKQALARFKRTILLRDGISAINILRLIFSILITMLSLYYFFRAGVQVLAAADPNFTINAWGGPSRLGASLAHWLDAVILFYIQALVLHAILVKRVRT